MTKHYTIALDVGRTFIRTALMDEKGYILPESFSIFTSNSSASKEEILNQYVKIIKFNINSILHPDFDIYHIGFSVASFLNPDDFQLQLIESELRKKLAAVPAIRSKLNVHYQFHIEQEAILFAIGEYILRPEKLQRKRVLYLILGSRFSLTFLDNGEFTNPDLSTFRNQPFREGKVEDYISSQGIINIAKTMGLEDSHFTPKEIAELAGNREPKALEVYHQFGHNLGLALKDTIYSLIPDEIIIGGNIALSYPIFKEKFEETINRKNMYIQPTEHTSYYIFFGISELVKDKNNIMKI